MRSFQPGGADKLRFGSLDRLPPVRTFQFEDRGKEWAGERKRLGEHYLPEEKTGRFLLPRPFFRFVSFHTHMYVYISFLSYKDSRDEQVLLTRCALSWGIRNSIFFAFVAVVVVVLFLRIVRDLDPFAIFIFVVLYRWAFPTNKSAPGVRLIRFAEPKRHLSRFWLFVSYYFFIFIFYFWLARIVRGLGLTNLASWTLLAATAWMLVNSSSKSRLWVKLLERKCAAYTIDIGGVVDGLQFVLGASLSKYTCSEEKTRRKWRLLLTQWLCLRDIRLWSVVSVV